MFSRIVAFSALLLLTVFASPIQEGAQSISRRGSSGGPFTGGFATYFFQYGTPGACGQVNPDTALVCAMDSALFGTAGPASNLCGKQVQVTNTNNGKTVTVTVVDNCPTCNNAYSIDLSLAAFQALSDLSIGTFPIVWQYVS